MFERFTDRARQVVVLAQEEARRLNHNYVGTEHILLGLLDEGHGIGAKALAALDVSLDAVREQVTDIVGIGSYAASGHIPFTPKAKKVLELSLREALVLGDNYIGSEHILLGLLREGDGVAAQVLVRLGCDLNRVRQQVIQLQGEAEGRVRAAGPLATGEAAEQILGRRALPRQRWMNDIQGALARLTERVDAIERALGMPGQPAETAKTDEPAEGEPAAAEKPAAAAGPAPAGEPPGAGRPGEAEPGGAGEPPGDGEQAR